MRKKMFSEEQIALALREAETGTPVAEVCRKMEVSEQSFCGTGFTSRAVDGF